MTQLEQKHREAVIRQVGRRIVGGGWKWRGSEFCCSGYCEGGRRTGTYVNFVANYNCIKVTIDEVNYNMPNPTKTFTGENALSEAVEWTAEELIKLDKIVSARVAKYEAIRDKSIENYSLALKGLI